MAIFVKQEFKERISRIIFDFVKTGFQGTLGNKGAVMARIFVDDSEVMEAI
jgi:hypothetical protein